MDILKVVETRYATKEFDETKKIDVATLEKLKTLLQKSPSSTNIQPWHFIMALTDEAKARIAKSTKGTYIYNDDKVLKAPVVIVFSSLVAVTDDYIHHVLDKEDADGRYTQPDFKDQAYAGKTFFANMHKYDLKDQQHWLEKQVYLNLGNFLLGVAALGLDAVPMEGCDLKVLNEEFGLIEKGYTASFLVAVGYHKDTDFNADLPKSRLAIEELVEVI